MVTAPIPACLAVSLKNWVGVLSPCPIKGHCLFQVNRCRSCPSSKGSCQMPMGREGKEWECSGIWGPAEGVVGGRVVGKNRGRNR